MKVMLLKIEENNNRKDVIFWHIESQIVKFIPGVETKQKPEATPNLFLASPKKCILYILSYLNKSKLYCPNFIASTLQGLPCPCVGFH